ncbi:hypothetical protein BDV27DRAFT_159938 [Aspergillus caelatus]|uniref:Saposin B-type domain-containing protein n=1 Tax=Aspergillus caelatus TaxID=61420 RepID=A0A5N6ZXL7_9EURO|nr:uncharacterized protein BDV27DRAFT_159938 [Aspergillus caelatus]KAE8362272.1 hypothetical protein BDV27DRAFT_159938 [Aspergillus caelatus]
MRLQISFLSLLWLFLLVDFGHAFVGPSCTKMKEALGNKPDIIFKEFKTEVCDKGCKPVIAHYDKWAKTKAIHPLIEKVMKDMGIPQHAKVIKGLAADVAKVIKQDCGKILGKGHLCQNPETLARFGNCLKGNLMPVVMGKIGSLMPLVTEPMCAKELAYLEKDDLWEKVIPKYLNMYSKVCKKL